MSEQAEGTAAKPAKTFKQRIAWVAAFAIAFVVVKEAKQMWFDARTMDNAGAVANKAMDDMRAKAVAENPGKPAAYAVQEEAVKQSAQNLAKETGDKKADTAAGQFIGFYMVNVRSRHDYCKSLGVDISPYTDAFKAEHKDLYAKSRVIHARSPYTPDQIESKMFEQLQPTFRKTIEDAMGTMARENKATEKAICEAFRDNGKELAGEMLLSKVNPALYQAMAEAK